MKIYFSFQPTRLVRLKPQAQHTKKPHRGVRPHKSRNSQERLHKYKDNLAGTANRPRPQQYPCATPRATLTSTRPSTLLLAPASCRPAYLCRSETKTLILSRTGYNQPVNSLVTEQFTVIAHFCKKSVLGLGGTGSFSQYFSVLQSLSLWRTIRQLLALL